MITKDDWKNTVPGKNVLPIALITLLGLILRVWGAGFGLPQTYHIDELHYVPDAVRYVSTANFKPSRWANPTFFKYLLALEYGIAYLALRITGQIESLSALPAFFRHAPSLFYLLGRLSSALLGTITIPVAYGIGARSYDKKKGLVAAFLLALCFLHLRDSHFAVSDVPMTFWFSATILCCILYLQDRKPKHLYWAAGLTGLAIATKYTAVILVVVFMTTWALARSREDQRGLAKALWNKELLSAFAVMGLSFLIICPYALLDLRAFLGTLRSHYGMGKTGFAGYQTDPAGGWLFYLKALVWGMGPVLVVTSIIAVGYALYRHRRGDLLILLPVLLLYIYLGQQRAYFARFIIPALPLLLVLAARLLCDISDKIFPASQKSARITVVALAVLTIAPSAVSAIRHNVLLTRTDTRTIAKRWIESHIPAEAKFFVEWHTPPLAAESQFAPNSNRTYYVDTSYIIGLAEHSLSYYREHGYQYLIASSFIYNIPRADLEENKSRRTFYERLNSETELVQTFKPYPGEDEPPFVFTQIYGPITSLFQFERPGPTIKIYKIQQQQACQH